MELVLLCFWLRLCDTGFTMQLLECWFIMGWDRRGSRLKGLPLMLDVVFAEGKNKRSLFEDVQISLSKLKLARLCPTSLI